MGGVGRQEKDLDVAFLREVRGLLFVVDCAIIEYQPFLFLALFAVPLFLSHLVHFFPDSGEHLLDEVEELVFAVGAFNYPPVSQAVFRYDGYQRKSFAFGDGAVHSYLLVGPGPGFVTCHVKIESTLVQKVHFGSFAQNLGVS